MRGILAGIIFSVIFIATALIIYLREKRRTDEVKGELDTYYALLKEKRKTIRLAKRLNVLCKVLEKSDSKWSVFSKDISGEGVCLYLPEMLPQDALVTLAIEMPSGKNVSVQGKVAWIKELEKQTGADKRQFSAGIKFVKISGKDKKELGSLIKASLEAEK